MLWGRLGKGNPKTTPNMDAGGLRGLPPGPVLPRRAAQRQRPAGGLLKCASRLPLPLSYAPEPKLAYPPNTLNLTPKHAYQTPVPYCGPCPDILEAALRYFLGGGTKMHQYRQ